MSASCSGTAHAGTAEAEREGREYRHHVRERPSVLRFRSRFDHFFVHGDRDVVLIKRTKSRGKEHVVSHNHDGHEEIEHEHFVGGYRYKHKHCCAHGAHEEGHDNEDVRAGGHGDGGSFEFFSWKNSGGARGGRSNFALLVVLLASLLSLAAGSLLLSGALEKYTKDGILHEAAKICAPALTFLGASFLLASSSYFFVTGRARARAKDGRADGAGIRSPLLSSVSENDDEEPSGRLGPHFYMMCLSHTLSAWEDRMWQFAVPIVMMHIFKDTLLPGALFGLVQYLGVVLLMPKAGHLIDQSYRLGLLWYAIMIENLCILGTCASLGLLVLATRENDNTFRLTPATAAYYGAIVVLGVVGEVCNNMQTIALEKDWVVVMAGKDEAGLLPRMNVILKRIDLLCKVLAPGVIGVFLDLFGDDSLSSSYCGILVLALFNLFSWPIEYSVLREIHEFVPALQRKKIRNQDAFYEQLLSPDPGSADASEERSFLESIRIYWNHEVFLASLSFCMLYMTVLDNGTLITSYLTWRKVDASILGLQRGAGAIIGLLGTFLFMHLVSKDGATVERVGLTSIWFFAVTMAPSVVVLLLFGANRVSDYALIGGMIVSRAALWMFDLAERQVMQERVEETSRGVMNTMQVATYQTLYCVIQAGGMIFSNPSQFVVLAFISLVSLSTAAAVYTAWFIKHRHRHDPLSTGNR